MTDKQIQNERNRLRKMVGEKPWNETKIVREKLGDCNTPKAVIKAVEEMLRTGTVITGNTAIPLNERTLQILQRCGLAADV